MDHPHTFLSSTTQPLELDALTNRITCFITGWNEFCIRFHKTYQFREQNEVYCQRALRSLVGQNTRHRQWNSGTKHTILSPVLNKKWRLPCAYNYALRHQDVSCASRYEYIWGSGGIAPCILNISRTEIRGQLHAPANWTGILLDTSASLDAVANRRQFLSNGYRGSFPEGKSAEAWRWHSLQSTAEVRMYGTIPPLLHTSSRHGV
jgi:hypothetical protein